MAFKIFNDKYPMALNGTIFLRVSEDLIAFGVK